MNIFCNLIFKVLMLIYILNSILIIFYSLLCPRTGLFSPWVMQGERGPSKYRLVDVVDRSGFFEMTVGMYQLAMSVLHTDLGPLMRSK